MALSYSESDVTGIRFDVVHDYQDCNAAAVLSETVHLNDPLASPDGHAFATALLVISPGTYRVCATPLASSEPSADCAPVEGVATVVAEDTTQLTLISQCKGDPTGGLAPVVSLNKPPQIQDITADPSTYLTVCETLKLSASATDPEGDSLSYAWTLVAGWPEAHLGAEGATTTFSGPPGDYLVDLSVTDVHGGVASLSIPIHVEDAVCGVPQNVQDILVATCSPCHTTNPSPSAGVSFLTKEISYQNLVQRAVTASACNTRTRVIPGDAPNSYLIAKLRAEPEICGAPMPRGRPLLPEDEIVAIEAWIDDLPL